MPSLMRNVILLQWLFNIRPTGTQISRGFKVHNLITCESKVQGVVSLGRHWVLFALGRHWVLTNGTWHVLLQSGNLFELGGITILINYQLELDKANEDRSRENVLIYIHYYKIWSDSELLVLEIMMKKNNNESHFVSEIKSVGKNLLLENYRKKLLGFH